MVEGKALLVQNGDGQDKESYTPFHYSLRAADRRAAVNEVRILSKLRHPYIIHFRESFISEGDLCIIMDFARNGDLFSYLSKRRKAKKRLPPVQV